MALSQVSVCWHTVDACAVTDALIDQEKFAILLDQSESEKYLTGEFELPTEKR
jgi:hypothetical protein